MFRGMRRFKQQLTDNEEYLKKELEGKMTRWN